MGQYGFVRVAILGAMVVCLATPASVAATRQKVQMPAAAKAPEALYLRCRSVIFRKYGRASGDGRLFIDRTRMVELTDNCVRNAGRI